MTTAGEDPGATASTSQTLRDGLMGQKVVSSNRPRNKATVPDPSDVFRLNVVTGYLIIAFGTMIGVVWLFTVKMTVPAASVVLPCLYSLWHIGKSIKQRLTLALVDDHEEALSRSGLYPAQYGDYTPRIGDKERDQAAAELGTHLSAGRLTLDEYQIRLAYVLEAQTMTQVQIQFRDLPFNREQART